MKKIIPINHKKVQVIMQKLGLKGKCKRRKYRSFKENWVGLRICNGLTHCNKPKTLFDELSQNGE